MFEAALCKDCIKYEGNTGNGEKKKEDEIADMFFLKSSVKSES